jgi:hypothetical protein
VSAIPPGAVIVVMNCFSCAAAALVEKTKTFSFRRSGWSVVGR